MIRVSIVIWLIVAGAIATGVFQVKYEVQRLEEAVQKVRASIEADRDRLQVLQAEWSYLNRPARLARLAEAHLDLGPMRTEQVTRVELLPPRIDAERRDTFAFRDWEMHEGYPVPMDKPWSLRPRPANGTPQADRRIVNDQVANGLTR